jgi:Uma2 family endonuclease
MSTALSRPMSLAEFLEWEERQPAKYEFDGFGPVAMVGVSEAHALIQSNLLREVGNRLQGSPCRIYGSDIKIKVAGRIRYPDAVVVCTLIAGGGTILREPLVVFEILSEGTAQTDIGAKNREYRDTPSISRYVLLEQERVGATVFARHGAEWLGQTLGAGDPLALPELGVQVPLSDLYAGLVRAV